MKNKKMVATLASLCLIVVAVVAAVVGVLAAVNQSVASTFNVSYFAKNVNATVTLKSIGPNAGATGYEEEYAAAASGSTDTFLPLEGTRTATLTGKSYAFSWNSGESAFLGKAIYQFKFENNNTSGGHALSVTPTLSDVSALNIEVLTFTSTSELAATNVRAEWVEETGALDTATGHTFSLVSDTGYTSWSSGAISVAAASSTYFYLVVAVKNAAQSLATVDLGGYISFALTDPTSAT
jgi:hypothetical protein